MQEGQDPWQDAQVMNSYISTQQWGFRDSVEFLLDTPAHEQANTLGATSANPRPEPSSPCTLCSADDHDCVLEDCHGGATRKSPIDWRPLRELPDCVRSMQQELQDVKESLNGQRRATAKRSGSQFDCY